jgi:hypothetical protein
MENKYGHANEKTSPIYRIVILCDTLKITPNKLFKTKTI